MCICSHVTVRRAAGESAGGTSEPTMTCGCHFEASRHCNCFFLLVRAFKLHSHPRRALSTWSVAPLLTPVTSLVARSPPRNKFSRHSSSRLPRRYLRTTSTRSSRVPGLSPHKISYQRKTQWHPTATGRTPSMAAGVRRTSNSIPPRSRTSQCLAIRLRSKPTTARRKLKPTPHNMAKASQRQGSLDRWVWESQGCGRVGLQLLARRAMKESHRCWKSLV
jgi:hypothetical protein